MNDLDPPKTSHVEYYGNKYIFHRLSNYKMSKPLCQELCLCFFFLFLILQIFPRVKNGEQPHVAITDSFSGF